MTHAQSNAQPNVVVVIGNAGIKSLAALPFIQFLKQENIPIDFFVGSGGGAVLAAMVSAGYPLHEIPAAMARCYDRKNIMKFNYTMLLDLAGVPLRRFKPEDALLKNSTQLTIFKDIFKDKKLEELQPPVHIQVTDIFTGSGVVLKEGLVRDAAYASGALYPFLPPIRIGENWYVDGMYSSTLPLLEATKTDPKLVIAIDFSRSHQALPHGLVEYYANSMNRSYATMHTSQASMAMMLHDIEVSLIKISFPSPINLWDSDRIEEILEEGNKILQLHREELLSCYRTSCKEAASK